MKIAISLGLSLALTPTLLAQVDNKPQGKVVTTTLEKIRRTPEAYKKVWVEFTVQFATMGRVENPFFTEFVPERYVNFYCWGDNQKIWHKRSFKNVFGMMFMAKAAKQSKDLYDLDCYSRIQVTGLVKNIFQGDPWIEVTKFTPVAGAVNTAALTHMHRGDKAMSQRQWTKAIAQYSMAPADDMPAHVKGELHRGLGKAYLRLGEQQQAVQHIDQAVALIPEMDKELAELAHVARSNPGAYLDRQVTATQVADHERPMWEAFDVSAGNR